MNVLINLTFSPVFQSRYCFPVLLYSWKFRFHWTLSWVSLEFLHFITCACVCLCGVKSWWMMRARVLSHLDLFGPNKRGLCLSGPLFCLQLGLRAMNRRCLLTTHTWAPPQLGPISLSSALSIHTASSLFRFHYSLCPLLFSPRLWPGLLLPLTLWTLWCWLCWPFAQIMCTFGNGPFAQSSVCLCIYISQTVCVVNGLQREVLSLMY